MSDEELLDDIPTDDTPEAPEAPEADDSEVTNVQEVPEAPAPQPQQTVWSAFSALPEFQGHDERAIATRLYQALEREKQASHALAQYQQILPYARQYLENREPFEKWRAAQQAPAPQPAQPAAPPQEKKWWNPPELKDSYRRYIVKDEGGRDTIHPDAPLHAKEAITDFFQYRAEFADKFLTNPEEALAPMVSRLAQEQAQQIVQSQLEQAGRQQYVQTLEEKNRDWLYDTSGNVSPEGEAARNYIEQAKAMGISSPEARWNYALQMVERDLLHQVRQTQERQAHQQYFQQHLESAAPPPAPRSAEPPKPSQAEVNMEYLRRAASRTPGRAGVSTNSPEAGRQGMTFEERLRHTLSEDGLI